MHFMHMMSNSSLGFEIFWILGEIRKRMSEPDNDGSECITLLTKCGKLVQDAQYFWLYLVLSGERPRSPSAAAGRFR